MDMGVVWHRNRTWQCEALRIHSLMDIPDEATTKQDAWVRRVEIALRNRDIAELEKLWWHTMPGACYHVVAFVAEHNRLKTDIQSALDKDEQDKKFAEDGRIKRIMMWVAIVSAAIALGSLLFAMASQGTVAALKESVDALRARVIALECREQSLENERRAKIAEPAPPKPAPMLHTLPVPAPVQKDDSSKTQGDKPAVSPPEPQVPSK